MARRVMQRARLGTPPPLESASAGVTLLELLVVMLLLTITLTGLAALQLNTIRTVAVSKRGNEATRLAQSLVERYRTSSFANLPPAGGWTIELNDNNAQMVSVGVDGTTSGPFTVERFVEDLDGGKQRLITIKVTWLDQPQVSQSVLLSLRRFQ